MTERVQIPAYTDRWMMGDRYGEVINVYVPRKGALNGTEIACVKLDKSGKTVRVIYADCTVL